MVCFWTTQIRVKWLEGRIFLPTLVSGSNYYMWVMSVSWANSADPDQFRTGWSTVVAKAVLSQFKVTVMILIFRTDRPGQTVQTQIRFRTGWSTVVAKAFLSQFKVTVMILIFRTDRPGQTVQTQIRLLLEEQSDQGLHCLRFRLHGLDSLIYGRAT